jgi:hypothetical protein
MADYQIVNIDGEDINFPSSMSDDEVNAAAAKVHQQKQTEKAAQPSTPSITQPPVESGLDIASKNKGQYALGFGKGLLKSFGSMVGSRESEEPAHYAGTHQISPSAAPSDVTAEPGSNFMPPPPAQGILPAGATHPTVEKELPGGKTEVLEQPQQSLGLPAGELAGNIASSFVPAGGSGETIGKGISKVGEAVEDVGKLSLEKGLKPLKSTIKKAYGDNVADKTSNLMDDIVRFNLHNSGNFKKMGESASEMANDEFRQSDEALQRIAQDPGFAKENPVLLIRNLGEKAVSEVANAGENKAAQAVVNQIADELATKGLYKKLPIDQLVKVKQSLNKRGDLFVNGPAPTDADALSKSIRKRIYLGIVDKIGEVSPEIKQHNTNAKKLLDITDVANDAAFRTGKNNWLPLRETIGASAAAAAGIASQHHSSPEIIALAIAGALAGKALGQGRGAGLVINAGRAIQKAAEIGKTDIAKPIKKIYQLTKGKYEHVNE